jgi:hypothetical protein
MILESRVIHTIREVETSNEMGEADKLFDTKTPSFSHDDWFLRVSIEV